MKHYYASRLSIQNRPKRIIFLSVIVFLLFRISETGAQSLEWATKIGAQGYDHSVSAIDASGNVYSTGLFTGTVDFDPGLGVFNLTPVGGDDIFISALDSKGDFLWAKQIGALGFNHGIIIKTSNSGDLYICGLFYGVVDFDPGSGVYNLSSDTLEASHFLLKLTQNGDFLSAVTIGDRRVSVSDIEIDGSGNVHLSGLFFGSNINSNIDFDPGPGHYNLVSGQTWYKSFVLKLTENLEFSWVKTVEVPLQINGENEAISLAIDPTGNVFVFGYFNGTVDFDSDTTNAVLITSSISGDTMAAYILKLDSFGDFSWVKSIQGSCLPSSIVLSDEIYLGGKFRGTVDFDPGFNTYHLVAPDTIENGFIAKLSLSGNFIWAKQIESDLENSVNDIINDSEGNFYAAGTFKGTADFDPESGVNNLTANGGSGDAFILKLNTQGNYGWAKSFGNTTYAVCHSISVDNKNSIYAAGGFYGAVDFDPSTNTHVLNSSGVSDAFTLKWNQSGCNGFIFNDNNANCLKDSGEQGIPDSRAIITPGNYLVETNHNGIWHIDSLPSGSYTAVFDTSGNWQSTCSAAMNFVVTNPNDVTLAPDFGMISTQPCSIPDISIFAPFLRQCFSNQIIYVQACNSQFSTASMPNAYVEVQLDSMFVVDGASLPYTVIGDNAFSFNVGNLNSDQCINFTINTTVSCSTALGQTLCMQANLLPIDSCSLDDLPTPTLPAGPGVLACALPWDHSSLNVDGWCANDTVYFTVTNTGSAVNGNMQCYAPVRVYVDDTLRYVDSVLLAGGQTITYSYAGTGQTWILQADQHPLHPGNSHPNAHVEACGNIANWTPNLVNNLPLDDADPIVDIYCGVVSGAYDPNDKTGFPTGLGTQHEILPNQQLQYLIRFQNTGTDTAFNIVVRDTLDTDLNIFSVVPGTASHNYTFRMYGPRVLEWTFTNIMLPDSNVNEATSHGFLTFRVDQQPNLPNGTKVLNDADIYFDFNIPVITNQTVHTINNQLNNYPFGFKTDIKNLKSEIKVYPNPASNQVTIVLAKENVGSTYSITNQLGQTVLRGKLNAEQNSIDINNLVDGFYVVTVEGKASKQSVKLVKQ